MKDRTLIVLALLFLLLSVGSGVNKSLEAGNRMMGKPMALSATAKASQLAAVFQEEMRDRVIPFWDKLRNTIKNVD